MSEYVSMLVQNWDPRKYPQICGHEQNQPDSTSGWLRSFVVKSLVQITPAAFLTRGYPGTQEKKDGQLLTQFNKMLDEF